MALSLNKVYDKKLLYGISLGGAIIMNVIGSGIEYDAAVIDSAPSFLSHKGCPKWVDPLNNLPANSDKILIITGGKDTVLSQSMLSPLREVAHERGATTFHGEKYAHPFKDKTKKIYYQRLNLILNHLEEK
jgi:hypothetical protein